ncbi:hypothetical protein HYU12_02120 [Candidatus Woesearchaeota archaeon]|nr:hypothetical protein [Candidatus Woesearchaeota archaeon]
MAENSQTSRTTLHYAILPDLLKRKVLAVRTVGKLKLYKLDKESPVVRKLLEIDKELITGELEKQSKRVQAITA